MRQRQQEEFIMITVKANRKKFFQQHPMYLKKLKEVLKSEKFREAHTMYMETLESMKLQEENKKRVEEIIVNSVCEVMIGFVMEKFLNEGIGVNSGKMQKLLEPDYLYELTKAKTMSEINHYISTLTIPEKNPREAFASLF